MNFVNVSARGWRRLAGLAAGLVAASAFAQLPPPDDADYDAGILFGDRAVIINDLEPTLVQRYDGSAATLPQQEVWRFMCGSDPAAMDLTALEAAVGNHLAIINADETPIRVDRGIRAGLNVIFTLSGNVPSQAPAAFADAEAYLESLFSDPITVEVTVSFQNLGGGVLGATGSNYISDSWADSRTGLINGMDADDVIQDFLPTGSTIPVRYDGASATVTNENRVFWTRAAYRSTVGSVSGTAASMTYNTAFNWDWDPSNGVSAYSFQDVIIHETGHALGFTSGADFRTGDIEVLDVYRFQRTDGTGDYNPDSYAEFQVRPRTVSFNSPNDDANSDIITNEYRMSDGNPWQASHFREGCCGLMDPALASGQTFYPGFFTTGDRNMFDAIGWDYPACPGPGITQQPVSQDGCPGDTVFFSVAVNTGAVTYQWRLGNVDIVDGPDYAGATTANLAVIDIDAGDAGTYNCVITALSNGCSSVTENAELTIGIAPTVGTQPANQVVNAGSNAFFTVALNGPLNPQYQWRKNGGNISDGADYVGTTSSTLIVLNAQEADEGTYDCVISDEPSIYACPVTSNGATLTVNPVVVSCDGDLDGDSRVDFADFSILSSCFGQPCGDLTGDNLTDFADFSVLSADWGCDQN